MCKSSSFLLLLYTTSLAIAIPSTVTAASYNSFSIGGPGNRAHFHYFAPSRSYQPHGGYRAAPNHPRRYGHHGGNRINLRGFHGYGANSGYESYRWRGWSPGIRREPGWRRYFGQGRFPGFRGRHGYPRYRKH